MKKLLASLVAILPLLPLSAKLQADFTTAQLSSHPQLPGKGPFIIEVSGAWPSDCHPGEQKPVVESFDGETVVIGFEIIVVHVVCNDTDTPYRVLVDMSDALRGTPLTGDSLHVSMSFQGGEDLDASLQLACANGEDCAVSPDSLQRPEQGIYDGPALANQGLLVTRQGNGVGIFPLVYDESGANQWLFSGNIMAGDAFFAEILSFSGGDCFGCEPTGAEPQMAVIGHLSVLIDRPGVLQVKRDDGLFTEYRKTVFGYAAFQVGSAAANPLVDLAGRWGLSENRGTNPPLGDLGEFLPGAFDVELESTVPAEGGEGLLAEVGYRVATIGGQTLGQLVCKGQTDVGGGTQFCEFIDPSDAAEPLLLFYQTGPSSLSIAYGRPVIAVGTPPGGRAMRLD